MRIDLIHPAHYAASGRLVQAEGLLGRADPYLPHLGPLLMAALADGHEVRVIEEYHRDVDLDSGADVVGISAQIMQFDRAVDLSRAFRARGAVTVLGGYLPSMLPERVEGLFDAVVIGEGDELWPEVLRDVERGALRPVYRQTRPVDLTRLPIPRYDLIERRGPTAYPVQATRGCPFRCQYCSIAAVFDGGYRKRPVSDVVRDVEATRSRIINFCDDNLCEDIKYARRLFDAMRGAPVRWGTQTTINVAKHPDLLRAARDAGCRLMALGVETLDTGNLEGVEKTFQRVDRYAEAFERIMDAGISPHALIIFGLPADDPESIERTVDYLERLRVPIAQFFLMTPYPGTPSGDRIWESGKVFDFELSHLREPYVVFEPARMSSGELRSGWWAALENFYSLRSIARRLLVRSPSVSSTQNLTQDLTQNLIYRAKIRRGIHPVYFGADA